MAEIKIIQPLQQARPFIIKQHQFFNDNKQILFHFRNINECNGQNLNNIFQ